MMTKGNEREAKFRIGETVYDKATIQEGVIKSIRYRDDGWFYEVRWGSGKKSGRIEDELYSKNEGKALVILKKTEEFNDEYGNYINFLSSIYGRMYEFSKNDKSKYLTYHKKLRTLFVDIQSPLQKFLEEEYVTGRNRARAYRLVGEIYECFKSPSLEEHFSTKPEKPDPEYYYKQIIEHFVSYLRSVK